MLRFAHAFGHTVYVWPLAWPATSNKWNEFKFRWKKESFSNIAYLWLHFMSLLSSVSKHAVFLNILAVSSSLIYPCSLSSVKKRAGSISVIHGMDRGWVLLQVDKKISSFCCCLHALCTLSLMRNVLLWIDVQLRYCTSVALAWKKGVKYK